jgi:MATE family multidrug resistance protein
MARRAVLWCTGLASTFMGLAGVLFVLAPGTIVGLVTTQPAHLKLAPELIVITGFVQVPFAVSIVLRSALRGAGDAKAVMVIVWICTYLVRLPLVVILAGVPIPLWAGREIPAAPGLAPSLTLLWVGLCGEIVLRAAMLMARFAQGRWAESRI